MGRRLKRSDRVIRWIETYCRIPEGDFVGQPVRLRPFQKKIIRTIYDTPTRRAIITMGRKNAKTAIAAFLLLYHFVGPEAVVNSQLYSAAQSKDQASLIFELAAKIVRMSPDLYDVVGIRDNRKQLYCTDLGTVYSALSAEVTTSLGRSPVFVVHDELGQVPGARSKLYEALETAQGAHSNPLSIVISTQAETDSALLSILIDDAIQKLDPRTKLLMWSADELLDPFSLKALKQANPALGDFLSLQEVKQQANDAKRMPSKEASFRNLVLNQRINSVAPLIPKSVWQANGKVPDKDFRAAGLYAGLDLSSRLDLTALVYGAEVDDGTFHCWAEFFAPREGVHERALRDRVPYDQWAEEGFITLTPGASVDYDYVAHRLLELHAQFGFENIHFDRWRIDLLKKAIKDVQDEVAHGEVIELPLNPHGQGFKDMSPAVEALVTRLAKKQIRHGMNPVLTWCAANAVAEEDPAGNQKLTKKKSTGRIDGIVALAMALNDPLLESTESVYETRGLLSA